MNFASMGPQPIVEQLQRLFGNRNNSLYGLKHAIAVEQRAVQIAENFPNWSRINSDNLAMRVLRAAALLHDVGFASQKDDWSNDATEHLAAGELLTGKVLKLDSGFDWEDRIVDNVVQIVRHHDDMTYSYPSANNDGRPLVSTATPKLDSKYETILEIVREADAFIHSDEHCVCFAIDEWLSAEVPMFLLYHQLITTWRWHDSVTGNLRLIGKRLLSDTKSLQGYKNAIANYNRIEKTIKSICKNSGVDYVSEICHPSINRKMPPSSDSSIQLLTTSSYQEMVEILRRVSLMGDDQAKPYRNSKLGVSQVDFEEISPMAFYVKDEYIHTQQELFQKIMNKYSLGLWDLTAIQSFSIDESLPYIISPPIIERYLECEDGKGHRIVSGLVDGLHRCTVARSQGNVAICALLISEASYPLVPLPLEWDAVQHVKNTPKDTEKRLYRYPSKSHFPATPNLRKLPQSDEEARDFFRRDYRELGSKGKRK